MVCFFYITNFLFLFLFLIHSFDLVETVDLFHLHSSLERSKFLI